MWLDLLTAADNGPVQTPLPIVPYETIGIVLVALVTGITGVMVALIQRGRNRMANTPTPVTTTPVFLVTKEDWDKVRDSVTRLEAQFEQFRNDYDYHERWTTGEVREIDNQISRIKGQLGLP